MPKFIITGGPAGQTWISTYSDEDPGRTEDRRLIDSQLASKFPVDQMYGAGALEITLTRVIIESEQSSQFMMVDSGGHNRKLVLSGISLTLARPNRHGIAVMGEIMDDLERLMSTSGFTRDAPFKWVGLTLRYGLKNDDEPHFQRINKTDGELPLAIELDTHELIAADRAELKRLFTLACLKTLIHAGRKYKLPTDAFQEHMDQLSAEG